MKKYAVSIAGLLLLAGVIIGIKAMQIGAMINAGKTMVMPPTVISTTVVEEQEWEITLSSVGSLEAVQGVTVTADNPGRVTEVLFNGGSEVKAGDILIRQDVSSEQAQLRAAEASVALAKTNLDRTTELLKKRVASQSQFDSADALYKEAVANADNIRTSISKKTVKAPFNGRLGIRLVNVGKDLGKGDPIVSLQEVNPIYVNFSLPQQDLPYLSMGLVVRVKSDAVLGKTYTGEITAINPEVDPSTRSVRVQATLENEDHALLPGMFADVKVVLPESEKVLAVPATAIAYATYGDSVFVVAEQENEEGLVAQQQFVQIGKARGDYVAIDVGVSAGDQVVSGGVFKLRNGAAVEVNNENTPEFSLTPDPSDS
ncbi:membrane fusion protein, multidrug efflux system [Alteromonadaceae bacterium Bs31]|nr:membrane fusion protein, multidrug efflux system [Alteromonadaceae bacterium Bs31]